MHARAAGARLAAWAAESGSPLRHAPMIRSPGIETTISPACRWMKMCMGPESMLSNRTQYTYTCMMKVIAVGMTFDRT